MKNKTFNLYCDESTHLEHDGQPYMIYGYVSVAYNRMKAARQQIAGIKESHGYSGELKWTGIYQRTYPLYRDVVEYFFNSDFNFRAVVIDKSQIDNNRPDYTFSDFFFLMYFQLLHHKIDMENVYNIYFDIKDTCSQKKLHQLRDILRWNSTIRNFQFVRSHESIFIQLADVLMVAINYHLRVEAGALEGKNVAKQKIVRAIRENTSLPFSPTTKNDAKKSNLFFISLK
ncbi:MAG: DUF3800 domain-containing protein [Tannerellaceae bacterium]|jgi:hypothetical protein|nr:DUF3800 domain-containing protein [Tannerellaceae bacterium]